MTARPNVDRAEGTLMLAVLRAASDRLDVVDGARLDQLFVLETSTRAGRIAAPLRERFRRLEQDAAWRLEQAWEADVPHAAELAQLICVRDAAGKDVPQQWAKRLADACTKLGERRARFGAGTDAVLLATLLRGLAAIDETAPPGLVTDAEQFVDAPDTAGLYELSEALARHPHQRLLAERAAQRAFAAGHTEAGAAVARWWLVERWRTLTGDALAVAPNLIDTARRQSLTSAAASDARIIGMTIEVMGRASENLVIATTAEMAERASRQERRRDAEIVAWRFGISAAIAVAGVVNASRLLGWLLGHSVDRGSLQAAAGVLCVAAAWFVARGAIRVLRVYGIDLGDAARVVDVLLPLAASVVGVLIYR